MTWGFGDSEMERYQPFCDVVEECRNLNQLYRIGAFIGVALILIVISFVYQRFLVPKVEKSAPLN
jgi:hypothetical protein